MALELVLYFMEYCSKKRRDKQLQQL